MSEPIFYGHTKADARPDEWQVLEDHLRAVGALAAQFASVFGSASLAYLAGLWHDLGKYSEDFQRYIGSHNAEDAHLETKPGPRVDHSTAGAQYANKVCTNAGVPLAGCILAYIIAGHHAGLPVMKSTERSSLEERLKKTIPDYSRGLSRLPAHELPKQLPFLPMRKEHAGFDLMLYVRMLFSALVDADFLDTEAFMSPDRSEHRWSGDGSFTKLFETLIEHLKGLKKDAKHDGNVSEVIRAREEVLEACLDHAKDEPGFFSLTVPTGGGKTLSSLAFALSHASKHNKQRIIYAVPYTSIIEQTADVFRDVFESVHGARVVLEHHSTFVGDDNDQWSRLSSENWDAPIVVTTNVQFFESLFANRTSKCRKLHNIAGSIIILDEAQMLSVAQLRPSLEVLKSLVSNYECTVVLCTATQPALSGSESFPHGIENVTEIIPDPQSLYGRLKRVDVHVDENLDVPEVARQMAQHGQCLAIVNTKRDAAELFDLIRAEGDGEYCFHLSANMCAVHRTKKLKEIRERLRVGDACKVVSTQLIEAGVDVDFPVVYRAIAGIDSIAQAAGRCNREGKLSEPGEVRVFRTDRLPPPGMLRNAAQVTERIAPNYDDLLSLDAVRAYFVELYFNKDIDRAGVYRLSNDKKRALALNFDFPKVAELYRLIEENSESLIIQFDDNVADLLFRLEQGFGQRDALRKLQRYTVSVREDRMRELDRDGAIRWISETYPVLERTSLYDCRHKGLTIGPTDEFSAEELIQ